MVYLLPTPYRFTIYDFRLMHRRSYYPHNVSQQIVSTVTATSSSGLVTAGSRSVTPGDPRSDSAVGMHTDIGVPAELKGQPGFGVEEDLEEDPSGLLRLGGTNGHANGEYTGYEEDLGHANGVNGNGMQMRDLSEKVGYGG